MSSGALTAASPVAEDKGQEKSLVQLRYNAKSTKTKWEDIAVPLRIFYILDRGGLPDVDAPWIFQQLRFFILRLNIVLTLVQTIAIIVAFEPNYYQGTRNSTLWAVNVFCTLFFTIDLIMRDICAPEKCSYAFSFLNVFEMAGLIPFWIDVSGVLFPGLSQFLLLFRVNRLVRWLLYMESFEVIADTLAESTEVIAIFLLICGITLPAIGTTVYYAERGQQVNVTGSVMWVRECRYVESCMFEESPFQYASDGMWMAMSTVVSSPFGDLPPNTALGTFITGVCLAVSIAILAFPVMILSTNFAHATDAIQLRTKKLSGKRCAQLQIVQREYAKRLDFEAKKNRKSFSHRDSMAYGQDPASLLLVPSRARPISFATAEDETLREAMLTSATEVRYEPLLLVKRDHRGCIQLDQNRKRKTEFRFTVLLGSVESTKRCRERMAALMPPDSPRIARCRHLHVTRVLFYLEVPRDDGDFLKSLRLLRGFDDQIEQNRLHVDGTVELFGLSNVDENHVQEVAAALSRCRLHITASVVRSDPVHYEIPFFYEMLASTGLAQALKARKNRTGLVYATAAQVTGLIFGVHQLFQLPMDVECDEEVQVINLAEVNSSITNAILRECAVEVADVDRGRPELFLRPVFEEVDENGKPSQYYGLIPYKISGRSEKSAYLDAMFGFALGTTSKDDEEASRMSKMLCSVVVKAVRVRQMHRVEQL